MRRFCTHSLLLLTAALAGCDQSEPAKPPALMAVAESPIPSSVELETVVTLPSQRSTQLVPTGKSVFVLQSDSSPTSTLLQIVDGQVKPTALTSDAIAKSMSLPKARGQITSIAADGERVAFCYAGVNGQKPIAAIGTFNPANGEIFTTIDTFSLEQIDRDFITASGGPLLFARGEWAWAVRVERDSARIITIHHLRALQPELSIRKIDLSTIQETATHGAWEFSPAAGDGTFYLTDRASRWIRTVDSSGAVHHVARFDDTIASISPAANDAAGRVIVLASDRDGVNSTLLIQNGDAFRSLPASDFKSKEVDPKSLRMDRLLPVPGKPGEFLVYDGTSGRVLKLNLK